MGVCVCVCACVCVCVVQHSPICVAVLPQNSLSEELANMKKIQDDLLANKVPIGQKLQAFLLVDFDWFSFVPRCRHC